MTRENYVEKLLNAGLKSTNIRVSIIELLSKTSKLLSAQEIYELVRKKGLKINLSTVYRTLDKLTDSRIINRVNLGMDKQALYEFNRNTHHHFLVCQECNKVEIIYDCPLDEYEKKIQKEHDFKIIGHKVEFYGYCHNCLDKQKVK